MCVKMGPLAGVAMIGAQKLIALTAKHHMFASQITSQQSILERKKKTFDEVVEKTAALEDVVSAEQVAIAKELTIADPFVKNARDALQSIGPKEQQVCLRAISAPLIPTQTCLKVDFLRDTHKDKPPGAEGDEEPARAGKLNCIPFQPRLRL